MNLGHSFPNFWAYGDASATAGTTENFDLNASYVHLTSGRGYAARCFMPSTEPILRAYLYASLVEGTATLRMRIYSENTASSARPGSTLRATSNDLTVSSSSGTDSWLVFEFPTPYSPTVLGEMCWFVVDNISSAPTANFVSLRTTLTHTNPFTLYKVVTSTNGFSTGGTVHGGVPAFFTEQSGDLFYGSAAVAAGGSISNNFHGFGFYTLFDSVISGLSLITTNTTMSEVRIYESTQAPNDTPLYTQTFGSTGRTRDRSIGSIIFDSPVKLKANRFYYVMFYHPTTDFSLGSRWLNNFNSVIPMSVRREIWLKSSLGFYVTGDLVANTFTESTTMSLRNLAIISKIQHAGTCFTR